MGASSPADPLRYVPWLVLTGFLSEQDALQLARMPGEEPEATAQKWQAKLAESRVAKDALLAKARPGPLVRPFPAGYNDRIQAIKTEPTFQDTGAGSTEVEFAMVELSQLRVFQPLVNEEFVDKTASATPDPSDLDGTIRTCLPLQGDANPAELLTAVNPQVHTYIVSSESIDLRVIGETGKPEELPGGRKKAGFVYGFGSPLISVVNYRGKVLLRNGYHRAVALLKKGHRYMPCMYVTTDSFMATGAAQTGTFGEAALLSEGCPILSDFLSGAAIRIPRRRIRALLSIHAEVTIVPV